jgi:L-ascorbate metabolism protein UlaG (beta-lactamase superfamily)
METPAGMIYFAADTGYGTGAHFRAVQRRFGRPRLALLPIGAYEPRWFMETQHQNPDEAVRGHKLCGATHTAGHHWGTFNLTNEGIEEPLKALGDALEKHGVSAEVFRPLRPGEAWDVPAITP